MLQRGLSSFFSRFAQVRVVLKEPALQHSAADRGTVQGIFDRFANLAYVVFLVPTAPHPGIELRAPGGTKNDLAMQHMQLRAQLVPGFLRCLVAETLKERLEA